MDSMTAQVLAYLILDNISPNSLRVVFCLIKCRNPMDENLDLQRPVCLSLFKVSFLEWSWIRAANQPGQDAGVFK